MTWTRFMDMHSGGGLKEAFGYCYIEAPEDEAKLVFYHRFGHNPERVSCTCCGDDYSISEAETLADVSWYERGATHGYFRPDGSECPQDEAWVRRVGLRPGYRTGVIERKSREAYHTVDEWMKVGHGNLDGGVHFIFAKDIKPEERVGTLPRQGYVWED